MNATTKLIIAGLSILTIGMGVATASMVTRVGQLEVERDSLQIKVDRFDREKSAAAFNSCIFTYFVAYSAMDTNSSDLESWEISRDWCENERQRDGEAQFVTDWFNIEIN